MVVAEVSGFVRMRGCRDEDALVQVVPSCCSGDVDAAIVTAGCFTSHGGDGARMKMTRPWFFVAVDSRCSDEKIAA